MPSRASLTLSHKRTRRIWYRFDIMHAVASFGSDWRGSWSCVQLGLLVQLWLHSSSWSQMSMYGRDKRLELESPRSLMHRLMAWRSAAQHYVVVSFSDEITDTSLQKVLLVAGQSFLFYSIVSHQGLLDIWRMHRDFLSITTICRDLV